nr:hypothetical protein [Tanacetum cinerariifolium]
MLSKEDIHKSEGLTTSSSSTLLSSSEFQSLMIRGLKLFFLIAEKRCNQAIRNSESYKEYYAIASGAEPPTTKASVRKKQSSSDTTMPPPTATGKRLKTSAKVGKPAKEKQPANGSGADEGTGIIPEVLDVPSYESDDEEIFWKSSEDDDEEKICEHDDDVDDQSDDDDQDDDNDEQTNLDNDGDDFVHPKFSNHDKEDKDEESFDPIVQTPSQVENTDDEDNDEDSHCNAPLRKEDVMS